MDSSQVSATRVTPIRRHSQSIGAAVGISTLKTQAGTEYFLAAESPPDLDLASSWNALQLGYQQAMKDAGLDLSSEVFLRLHVSDPLNQIAYLKTQLGLRPQAGLVTVVGQSPLQRNKLAIEAYHVKGRRPCRRALLPGGQLELEHGRYKMLWGAFRPRSTGTAAAQTTELLEQLEALAQSHNSSICDDLLRTWFFVRDIDINYQGLVDARRELFERWGLTAATHYVASTGIAGEMPRVEELVVLDALIECGMAPGQIRFMAAEDNLCPTHHYGVTFERGTQTIYGDRSHYYISGTASIDREGRILHEGDLDGQFERTFENIDALMSNHGAQLSDLKQAVVYLRDASDGERAQVLLASLLPRSVPFIVVHGRVCRPGWLVEIEGIGGIPSGDPRFADFF